MRLAYWELRGTTRRRDPRTGRTISAGEPVVCGRKFCSGCGHWRHLVDFGPSRGGQRARCYACTRAVEKQRRDARTPAQREADREYQRFWAEGQRRRRGQAVRPLDQKPYTVKNGHALLDVGPLLDVLRAYHAHQFGNGADGSWRELARRADLPERALRRYLTGESQHVGLHQADAITHALGIPLALVYPFEDVA